MYIFEVSAKLERIINKCLKLLQKLNLPISNSIKFIEFARSDSYGCCKINNNDETVYEIGINKFIIKDKDFEETVIHELLHTIEECGLTHNERYEKYVSLIRKYTNYKLIESEIKELEFGAYTMPYEEEYNNLKTCLYC